MKKEYIIHVKLMNPFQDESDFYFGSVAAVFDLIPEDLLKIKKSALYRHKTETWTSVSNYAIIKKRILKRKSK